MKGKRGNNEGSVYQRGDGKWCAAVSLAGGRRRVFYGKTREEASRKLTAAQRERDLGRVLPTRKDSTAAFLTRWLEEVAQPRLRPLTYKRYAELVNVHLIPELGSHPIDRLGPEQVQAFLNERARSGLSPRTVWHMRAVLRTALNQALRWGIVGRNVATLVDPPRIAARPAMVLSPAQAKALLDAVNSDRLEALYLLALTVGMRQGELLGLRWTDVDLEKAELHITFALQRVRGGGDGRSTLQLTEPKTSRSRRVVALPDAAVAALDRHHRRQAQERLIAGSKWSDTGFVFTTPVGTPLEGSAVGKRFKQIMASAGLPALRFHDLRHSAASLMLAEGVAPRIVMETLGHSQIALTMNTYTHVLPALQREAAAAMDRLLGATASEA